MFATRLKTQLLLITIIPLLLTVIVVSLFILFDVLDSIEADVVKRGESIGNQAALMAEFPLYTGDVDALRHIARLMIKTHDLAYIRFIDSTGGLLVHEKSGNRSEQLRQFSFPVLTQRLALEDFSSTEETGHSATPLGSIDIGFTNNSAEAQRFRAYIKVLSISLVALAVGILLSYLFSRKLSRAISSLVDTAERLEKKEFSARATENGAGELLNFQRTFNKMIAALAQKSRETIELERSKAILEERERIMRDMHDGIGGQLVASLALLEREQDSDIKRNIHSVLTECLNDLRLIIHSLSMQNSVLSSLLADFKYRTSRKLEQLDVELNWQVADKADELAIKPQASLHLLRILQEAFTNILKHSGASQIHFEASEQDGVVNITIEDNGRFSPPQHDLHRGHGISNMKSRAGKLGGSLDIEQAASGGCRLILSFPV